MVRVPEELLERLRRNQQRNQRVGAYQAGVGALGAAGVVGKYIFDTIGNSADAAKKRKRDLDSYQSYVRKRPKTEKPSIGSFLNLRSSAKMADSGAGQGSGNAAGLRETPVDQPWHVFRGPPNETFASLPFVRESVITWSNLEAYDNVYRMTSVYDCSQDLQTVDYNTNTGIMNVVTSNPTDSAQRAARWFDFYAGMYNYYHVMGCRYKITVENLSMEPLYCHLMFANDIIPPIHATNDDIMLWPGVNTQVLSPIGYAVLSTGLVETNYLANAADSDRANDESATAQGGDTFETGNLLDHPGRHICQFAGVYRTGDFKREIRLDSEVENWTAISTNPALSERLYLRLKPSSARVFLDSTSNAGDTIKARVRVELEYLTEFKELKEGLRYPVQRQPVVVTIQNDPTTTG